MFCNLDDNKHINFVRTGVPVHPDTDQLNDFELFCGTQLRRWMTILMFVVSRLKISRP